ncbi:MAG TPA: type II CAAX endopeptidase family protein [Candidatus Acidoferrales bacterium]
MNQERYGVRFAPVNRLGAKIRAIPLVALRGKCFHHIRPQMHWDYAVILAFLVIVLPLVGKWRVERILRQPETNQAERLRLYASTIAFQWLLVALIAWRTSAHGITTAELGLMAPFPLRTALVALGLASLILLNQLVSLRFVGSRPEELQGKLARVALRIFPQDNLERLVFFGVVTTVAICEEFIYRGFVQGLFALLFQSAVAGVLVSAAMFSVAHLYQGKRGLVATCVVGILFAAARAFTGSLIPAVCAHFVTDFVAGYMFPSRLRNAIHAEAKAAEN